MDEPFTIEFTGPPLAEIAPGVYDLTMRDGSMLLAIVDRSEDGTPWWAPLGALGETVDTSMDWSAVVGAVAVGVEDLARRRPDLVDGDNVERMRGLVN